MSDSENDYPDTAPPWLPCEQLDQMCDAFARAIADLSLMNVPPAESTAAGYVAMRDETHRVHAERLEYLRATHLDVVLGVTA